MIRFGKIQLNLLLIPFLIVAFVAGAMPSTCIAYLVVSVHELAHFFAARKCGVDVVGLIVMPFGISLRMKEEVIRNPADEMAICAAGPAANFFMILLGLLLKYNWLPESQMLQFFLISNLSIMFINIIPILPLDGGRIFKAWLTNRLGSVKAFNITNVVSKINIALLAVLGLVVLWITKFNVSVVLLAAFLIFNIGSEKQGNHIAMMRQLANSKQKLKDEGILPVRELAAAEETAASRLLKEFSYHCYCIVRVMDGQGQIVETLTETQLIDAMVTTGSEATLRNIVYNKPDIAPYHQNHRVKLGA